MTKATLEQQDNMPDPLGSTDFRLTFSSIPGSPNVDIERIALNCTQAVIPGITINKFEQRFAGGHKLNYGMTVTHAGVAAMNFIERVDGEMIRLMRRWQEFIRGTRTGNAGGYKRDYAVTGRLEVLDPTDRVALEITLHNMFIQEFPEVQLDTTSDAQGIQLPISFNYDWWKVTGQELG
jgi:hypothetical protein